MGHPKEVQQQGQGGNLFRNCYTPEQCLSGRRVESPRVWQFKIPQAEQRTFGDALPAGPALHSLSVGATKRIFMENQTNKDLPHLYWCYINFQPSFSGESLPLCSQNVLSRPQLPLNSKRLMRLQGTDALPTHISRTNNSYHKTDLNIYKMVNAAANTQLIVSTLETNQNHLCLQQYLPLLKPEDKA